MKKKKLIIIGAIAAVAVIAIVGLIVFLVSRSSEDETQVYADLESVKYISYSGESYEGALTKKGGNWYWEHDEELPVDQEAISAEIERIREFLTIEQMEEVEDLETYGLDKPTYTIKLKTTAGRTKTIYIGDPLGDDAYYATINNKKSVYVVTSDIIMFIDSLDVQKYISEDEAMMMLEDIELE